MLRGVSFTLEQGETVAVIGSSGSGKTTPLRCINFLETPDGDDLRQRPGRVRRRRAEKAERERETRLHFGLVFRILICFRSIPRCAT